MSIIRVKKDAKYFSASNEPFNDTRLSWESRGLMGYLLSKPNDWQVRMPDLEKQGPAGEHKLRRMLAELRRAGYMNRIRVVKEGHKFDWVTEVYESPSQNPRPASWRFSTSGSSTSGELPDIESTDSQSTESDDEEANPLEKFDDPEFGKIVTDWNNLHTFLIPTHANLLGCMLDEWRAHARLLPAGHPDKKLDAVAIFKEAMIITGKNARNPHSLSYMDRVIKNWIHLGYGVNPNGKKASRTSGKSSSTPQPRQTSPEELARLRAEADLMFGASK